jgi:hypothetical protein
MIVMPKVGPLQSTGDGLVMVLKECHLQTFVMRLEHYQGINYGATIKLEICLALVPQLILE